MNKGQIDNIEKYLIPWIVPAVLAVCTIAILSLFFPPEKLRLSCLPIAVGGVLAASGYNIYELIVSFKNKSL